MQSRPQSDRPPLSAPGYVRMPGRPKKERKREPSEKPKPAKISRVGTIIICRKCKQIGHNRSTCDKRNGAAETGDRSANAQSSTAPRNYSGAAPQQPSSVTPTTQQSCSATRTRKRKAPSSSTGNASTSLCTSATKKHGSTTVVKSSAKARVQTTTGKIELNLHASVPMSQASSSVTINMTSGKAQAHVQAEEPPRKKLQVRRGAKALPMLLMKGPAEEN